MQVSAAPSIDRAPGTTLSPTMKVGSTGSTAPWRGRGSRWSRFRLVLRLHVRRPAFSASRPTPAATAAIELRSSCTAIGHHRLVELGRYLPASPRQGARADARGSTDRPGSGIPLNTSFSPLSAFSSAFQRRRDLFAIRAFVIEELDDDDARPGCRPCGDAGSLKTCPSCPSSACVCMIGPGASSFACKAWIASRMILRMLQQVGRGRWCRCPWSRSPVKGAERCGVVSWRCRQAAPRRLTASAAALSAEAIMTAKLEAVNSCDVTAVLLTPCERRDSYWLSLIIWRFADDVVGLEPAGRAGRHAFQRALGLRPGLVGIARPPSPVRPAPAPTSADCRRGHKRPTGNTRRASCAARSCVTPSRCLMALLVSSGLSPARFRPAPVPGPAAARSGVLECLR